MERLRNFVSGHHDIVHMVLEDRIRGREMERGYAKHSSNTSWMFLRYRSRQDDVRMDEFVQERMHEHIQRTQAGLTFASIHKHHR